MKNKDKYKTYEDAYKAWGAFCMTQNKCMTCPYRQYSQCSLKWLYDEAKDDDEKKPTPQWQKNILNKFTSKE